MKRNLLAMLFLHFLIGCAPTLNLKSKPEAINICPVFAENEDSLITQSYKTQLNLVKNVDSTYIKSVSCDSILYPKLSLYYDRTFIAGQEERNKALAITALGIGLPVIMIAAEMPFFLFFWSNPVNQSSILVDFTDSLEIENKTPKLSIQSLAWSGSRELQVEKQAVQSRKILKSFIEKTKKSNGNLRK